MSLVGLNVVDDAKYDLYRKEMLPILEKYGGGFSYDFRVSEVLISQSENSINRVFTIYFPDEATAGQFFSDSEYVKVKESFFVESVNSTTMIGSFHV